MNTMKLGDHLQRESILVLVHPGSACGSANFNLGDAQAQACRALIADELATWEGGVIVIDGALSDELPGYPELQKTISDALCRAKASGQSSVRVWGDDPDQVPRIRELAEQAGPAFKAASFTVTGAWYHPEDASGCVGSVIQELRLCGCEAEVSSSAVCLTMDLDAVGHVSAARER